MSWIYKCGTNIHGHYDRRGDYSREGVDPRNNFGRYVEEYIKAVEYEQRLDDIQRALALEAITNA